MGSAASRAGPQGDMFYRFSSEGMTLLPGKRHLQLQIDRLSHALGIPYIEGEDMEHTVEVLRRQLLDQAFELADAIEGSHLVADRSYHMKTYPACFVGQEAVDWLMQSRPDAGEHRAWAVDKMQLLIGTGLANHVCGDHAFKDEYLFYRLTRDEQDQARFGDVAVADLWLNATMQGTLKLGPKFKSSQYCVSDGHALHCFESACSNRELCAIPLQHLAVVPDLEHLRLTLELEGECVRQFEASSLEQLHAWLDSFEAVSHHNSWELTHPSADHNTVVFEKLTPENAAACSCFFAYGFCTGEVMAKHVGVRPQELQGFAEAFCTYCAAAGLSYVALFQGRVVGLVLCEDLLGHPEHAALAAKAEALVPPQMVPVFAILEDLHAIFKQEFCESHGEEPALGQVVHVIAGLTDPRLRGGGLAVSLFARCYQEAASLGYKWQVSEATGFQSQRLLKHYATMLGPENYAETHISYKDWQFEGEHVFSGLAVPSLVLSSQTYPAHGSLQEEVLLCVFFCGTASGLIRQQSTSTQLQIYAHLQAATVGAPDPSSKPPRLEVTELLKWKAWRELCHANGWGSGPCAEAGRACLELISTQLDPEWRASLRASQSKAPPKISPRSPDDAISKATWAPDHSSQSCMLCHNSFSWSVSRHHCRKCGILVCSKCSRGRVALPADGYVQPTRVCDRCMTNGKSVEELRAALNGSTEELEEPSDCTKPFGTTQ